MKLKLRKPKTKQRGASLVVSFMVLSLLAVAATAYIDSSTATIRHAKRVVAEAQTGNLAESGVQEVLRALWRPFKQSQNFNSLDDSLTGATSANPKSPMQGAVPGIGTYAAGVVDYRTDPTNQFVRFITVRSVGWTDLDNDGVMDNNEPNRSVDVTARFELARSEIFDYTYFINNYGWMDGFNESQLVVNGDMRANGNFDFRNGSPTVNGSVFAAVNDKLNPRAVGLINSAPVKMTQSAYSSWTPTRPARLSGESDAAFNARVAEYTNMIMSRRRPSYSSATHGADGSTAYDTNRDFVFRSDGGMVNGKVAGAVVGDAQGVRAWTRTRASNAAALTMLDTNSTREIVMPDLSDLSEYQELSRTYRNPKANFQDGTANPNFGQGAFLEVWNSTTNSYQRLDTQGQINGSVVLVGTQERPIRIHGPVTVSQDVVIKGFVEGQGTLYSGRNTHIVGSIRYKNGPDFRSGSIAGNDSVNEKRDFLGLAARGSVMMGNPTTFSNPFPLAYMTPVNPPSKMMGTYGRFDENGTWIPPFDAMQIDSTGRRRFQSVIPDTTMNAIAEGVNQIDAVMYSNFVGGGNVGTSGAGMVMNGTIIARDEAIVTWSLPIIMNYDNRIREREISNSPLIDLELPRSPVLLRSTWQDRGFVYPVQGGRFVVGGPN